MFKFMSVLRVPATLVFLAVLGFDSVHANSFDTTELQGLGDTHYHELQSDTLNRSLHIPVRVPASAFEHPRKQYPKRYLLDGGVTYPLLSAYYHYLRYTGEIAEMVLVGISSGSAPSCSKYSPWRGVHACPWLPSHSGWVYTGFYPLKHHDIACLK